MICKLSRKNNPLLKLALFTAVRIGLMIYFQILKVFFVAIAYTKVSSVPYFACLKNAQLGFKSVHKLGFKNVTLNEIERARIVYKTVKSRHLFAKGVSDCFHRSCSSKISSKFTLKITTTMLA